MEGSCSLSKCQVEVKCPDPGRQQGRVSQSCWVRICCPLCVGWAQVCVTDQLLCSTGVQGEKGPRYQPWMVLLEWGQPRRETRAVSSLLPSELLLLGWMSLGARPGSLAGLCQRMSTSSVMLDQLFSGLASVLRQSRACEFNWPLPG